MDFVLAGTRAGGSEVCEPSRPLFLDAILGFFVNLQCCMLRLWIQGFLSGLVSFLALRIFLVKFVFRTWDPMYHLEAWKEKSFFQRIFHLFCHQFLDTIAESFVDLTPQREARL